MTKANGWDNHEDSFVESLRRELLAAQQIIHLLKEDLKQMTEAYYNVLDDENRKKFRAGQYYKDMLH
tara:strand:- start:234 stop:434 length:201 start_codon:yes stop_codon:yes gene_type:complete